MNQTPPLNTLTYGNPNLSQKFLLDQTSILDDIFEKFQNHPFPLNQSEATKEELNSIAEFNRDIQNPDNNQILFNYLVFDKNLQQTIINIFAECTSLDISDLVQNIHKDVQPLLLKLKYFYNRPRPFQLANQFRLKLFPFESRSAGSPSYPSGHTLSGAVILKTIAIKYPSHKDLCEKLIDTISYSRIYLGHHYQSDNDFSHEIADEILNSRKFLSKYNI